MREAALGGYSSLWTKMKWNQRQLCCKTEGSTAWDVLLAMAIASIRDLHPGLHRRSRMWNTQFEILIAIDVLPKCQTSGKPMA